MKEPSLTATISVVIPTCDRHGSLRDAVSSVMEQTRRPDEVIIVDNGTVRVPPTMFDESVHVVTAPARAGASQARNIGAASATCEYLAFLDDDDTWERHYLEEIGNRLVETEPVLVGALYEAGSDKSISGKNAPQGVPQAAWYRRNYGLVGSNLVIARDLFLDLGGFDCTLRAAEDVDLAIRLLDTGHEIVQVPRARAYYDRTRSPDSLSAFRVLVRARRFLLRKHFRNPIVRWFLLAEYAFRVAVARSRDTFGSGS